ncbi:hypothetical protein PIB30_050250 [Stylosanthes scabra]|uniref:Uncharacterized protein n=1 Tax=Stylosanthes scabra TaxID=79078 RepID=A0ABU6SHS9_9FABA|nr:hypothetical protein [Stylosanthes scabra]
MKRNQEGRIVAIGVASRTFGTGLIPPFGRMTEWVLCLTRQPFIIGISGDNRDTLYFNPRPSTLYHYQFLLFLIFALVTDTQPLQPRYFHNHSNSEPVAREAMGRPSNGAVTGELKTCALVHGCLSNSDPNLLLFDPEIERTLRRARQVRRRIEFENNLRSQTENLASVNNSSYSSDFDFEISPSSHTGTSNMGDIPRITLKQMGGASMALENQPFRFPELMKILN